MPEAFKFPDETPDSPVEEVKVEIVDDTPPEDRNRQPIPKESLKEVEDDNLEEYSDKVKNRIDKARKAYHDERREKERATREREEAVQFAQRALEENRQLKQRLGAGEKVFVTEVTKAATTEVTSAKDALKRAYESGDAERITEAQEQLTDAKIKLREFQNFRPSSLQEDASGVQPPAQVQPAPRVITDDKAETWRRKNTWFGSNRSMTALALGLHEELVESGVDPTSDSYYQKVDTTMRKRFPEYFSDEPTPQTEREEPSPRKQPTVVAPVTRSTAPRQVRLTASQASIAKRLGVTPEAYAREMIKQENSNG